MNDTVHPAVHPSVHLCGEQMLHRALNLDGTRQLNLGAGKTTDWAGATPLLTAFSRPKFCGVAPARHAGSVTVFWPRAGVGERKS